MQIKKPTVLVNIPYGSTWFVPAGNNFMAHLIRDAGGYYVFADTKGNFNLKLSLEAVIESGLEADFWINQDNIPIKLLSTERGPSRTI